MNHIERVYSGEIKFIMTICHLVIHIKPILGHLLIHINIFSLQMNSGAEWLLHSCDVFCGYVSMIDCIHKCYGAVHLVTTTFGQWLCSSQIVVENFFEFNTSQIMLDNHHFCCLNALISICTLH